MTSTKSKATIFTGRHHPFVLARLLHCEAAIRLLFNYGFELYWIWQYFESDNDDRKNTCEADFFCWSRHFEYIVSTIPPDIFECSVDLSMNTKNTCGIRLRQLTTHLFLQTIGFAPATSSASPRPASSVIPPVLSPFSSQPIMPSAHSSLTSFCPQQILLSARRSLTPFCPQPILPFDHPAHSPSCPQSILLSAHPALSPSCSQPVLPFIDPHLPFIAYHLPSPATNFLKSAIELLSSIHCYRRSAIFNLQS